VNHITGGDGAETGLQYSHYPLMLVIDGFQMSIKCPTSGGQTHDQELTVQWSFHFRERAFFSFGTNGKDSM